MSQTTHATVKRPPATYLPPLTIEEAFAARRPIEPEPTPVRWAWWLEVAMLVAFAYVTVLMVAVTAGWMS